jgi:hypothetical protein
MMDGHSPISKKIHLDGGNIESKQANSLERSHSFRDLEFCIKRSLLMSIFITASWNERPNVKDNIYTTVLDF